MKKANKTRFIVLLCLAFTFIAGTLALLFIPEPKPLKVTEKVTAEYTGGECIIHGKIKNVTKSEIILDAYSLYAEIGATTENGGITLYGSVVNNGKFAIFALLSGIIGVAFLIVAIVSYIVDVNNAKRVNNIIAQTRQTFGDNAFYVIGGHGNKAENRTAAAKTTASVFKAIATALFFGFGRYKVYSQSDKSEFIITETAIYMYLNGKFQDVTNEIKAAFLNPALAEKKNKIYVKGENKNLYLTIRANTEEKAEILNFLKNIFGNQTQTEILQGQNNGETN